MTKCDKCYHNKIYCPYRDARRCQGDPLYSFLPQSYMDKKDWINNQEVMQ